ncbi:MAG: DNA/RNA nuclease SfsA [Caldilineaceae bacterium]
MKFDFVTEPATFLERPNRYRIVARLHAAGRVIHAHCPDPGRLRELLIPGVTVHVSKAAVRPGAPPRKTEYDLRFVNHPEHGQLVSLDTRLPNAIFQEGLEQGFFAPFRGYHEMAREVTLDDPAVPPNADGPRSRFDFRLLDATGAPVWIETKSASLVEDRVAIFPDAPTERGRRHVLELTHLAQSGVRTAVVFIVQRPDADRLRPHWGTDPAFAQALVEAKAASVEIYAYTCQLSTTAVQLAREIPVELRMENS